MIELLRQLNRERGVTIICATHDQKMLQASQRICAIRDGRIDRIATYADIDELVRMVLGRKY